VCSAQRLKAKIVPAAPKIASNNRLAGTAEDNKAIVAGTLALFGTYSVDEAKKTLTFNINAADEAGLKGDLDAASKCATPQQVEQSQKKLEDAAANAKSKQEGRRPDQNGGSDRR
jgi:putative aminopeptidase FrvX